jgi:hypothetical protein
MKILFFRANFSRGLVARASRLCVSTKAEFLETHGRDARATILVAACRAKPLRLCVKASETVIQKIFDEPPGPGGEGGIMNEE